MFLFGRNKLKMRSEEDNDKVRTFVEYFGIKQKDVFKANVFKTLIGNNLCLGILDSNLLYSGPYEESEIELEEIIEHMDSTGIAFKKFEVKKVPEISVFGITVKKGSKKTDKDYIIGFVINKDNFEKIEEHVRKINMYYFIDRNNLDEEALLRKFEENYHDIEEIGKNFHYQIFNNNFNEQLVILSEPQTTEEIKETINKCYLELK